MEEGGFRESDFTPIQIPASVEVLCKSVLSGLHITCLDDI
jgi:hypothetical protein